MNDGLHARKARFLRLQVRLRVQREKMQLDAATEFQQVVESVAYRLHADDQADLIAYHVRKVWQRFALSLPKDWQRDMAAYVRKYVARDPWFRAPMAERVPMNAEQVREFAKLLVASRRHKNLHATTHGVEHG
ncbi:MAG: hypothetical protein JNK02_01965 [Planctomycetes bacterium]|nr:hypothetical protein [Planctomycetota bacterium]